MFSSNTLLRILLGLFLTLPKRADILVILVLTCHVIVPISLLYATIVGTLRVLFRWHNKNIDDAATANNARLQCVLSPV